MNKCPLRKTRYMEYLKKLGVLNAKFMPTVVLTRWNTWYKVIKYLDEYIIPIRDYIRKEKREQEESELVNKLYLSNSVNPT